MRKIISTINQNKLYGTFFSMFSFALISSYAFYYGNGYKDAIALMVTLMIAVLSGIAITLGVIRLKSLEIIKKDDSTRMYAMGIYAVALFVMQLPYYLAFFPGIIFYDIGTQIEQYETGVYAANHPLLHTLFMGAMKNAFDNPNQGYALAIIIQMVVVDLCIGYMLFFTRKKTNRIITLGLLLALGLNPIVTLLCISSTKDIAFTALMCVVLVDIYRITTEKLSVISIVRIILITALMLMMRSNAIYAFVPTMMVVLWIYKENREKVARIVVYLLFAVLLAVSCNKLLIRELNAYEGSIKEMLSVPAQIDARIYNEVANKSEKEIIRKYIECPEEYKYYISDPIKEQFEFDSLDSQCKHFLLDTTLLALKHPIVALDAFMYNTQGYWDMFHSAYQEQHQYVARAGDYRGGAYIDSGFVVLKDFCMRHFRKMDYSIWNPLALLGQMGIYIWMLLWALVRSVKYQNKALTCSCLFAVLYFCTLLLGPSAIMRYGMIFMLFSPVAVTISYIKKDDN